MSFAQFKLCFLLAGLRLSHLVAAQSNTQFGQVVNINGDMSLNTFIFPDNSKIELFSQTQRQLLVNQNPAPLSANHVIGSTGQPFVQLSTNSMSILTNGATDLVGAQIEMSINPIMLHQSGVTADNAFVAMLSQNRQAWIVVENLKAVNTTDNTVRMIKLNAIDGEYMAIGRQTVETSNVVTPFGSQQQSSVNISGSGIQEVEFQDGFRMSIISSKQMTVSANVKNGISSFMLPNTTSVNNYRYRVTTNMAGILPNLDQMIAVVQLPLNPQRLMTVATAMGIGPNDTVSLGISQRGVIQNTGGATGNLSPQKRQEKATSVSSSKAVSTSTKSDKTSASTSKAAPTSTKSDKTSASTSKAAPTSTKSDKTSTSTSKAASTSSKASSTSSKAASTSSKAASTSSKAVSTSSKAASTSTKSDKTSTSTSKAASTSSKAASTSTKSFKTSTSTSAASKSTAASAGKSTKTSRATASQTTLSSSSSSSSSSATAWSSALASPPSTTSTTTLLNPTATQLLLSPTFTPIIAPTKIDTVNMRVAVTVSQLDGEFIITMTKGTAQEMAGGGKMGEVVLSMYEIGKMVERQKSGGGLIDILGMIGSLKAAGASGAVPSRRLKRRETFGGDSRYLFT